MQKAFNRRSGNRYVLFSIVLIILMIYTFSFFTRDGENSYPEYVYYGDTKYQYTETVQESPLQFVRKYGKGSQGYALLIRKAERNKSEPQRVYVYEGWRRYREYQILP